MQTVRPIFKHVSKKAVQSYKNLKRTYFIVVFFTKILINPSGNILSSTPEPKAYKRFVTLESFQDINCIKANNMKKITFLKGFAKVYFFLILSQVKINFSRLFFPYLFFVLFKLPANGFNGQVSRLFKSISLLFGKQIIGCGYRQFYF